MTPTIAPQRFWYLLVATVVVSMVLLLIWDALLPASQAVSLFTLICVAIFTSVNIIAYFAGLRAVRSNSRYRFIHVMMGLILFKMMICVGLVVAYVRINHPESKLFVLPFLTIYLVFTLFEIYVLEKIARTKTIEQVE